MRRYVKWPLRIILMGTLAAAVVGVVRIDELRRLMAVNTLFEPDRIVSNFSQMDRAFLYVPLTTGDSTPLPDGSIITLPEGMNDWMAERRVTSMVVLK